MRVLSAPLGLRLAAATLFLSVPISAFAVVVARHSPWWRLPYGTIALFSVPTLSICAILAFFLLRASALAFRLTTVFTVVACGAAAWATLRFHNTSLGFFMILMSLGTALYLAWLRAELGRSFLDPQIRWYHGLPKPIPGLDCEMDAEPAPSRSRFRVSRIDREGAFLFREAAGGGPGVGEWVEGRKAHPLVFRYRDREVRCAGAPVVVMSRAGANSGIGVQFRGMTPDMRKQLGDFIETIKGEGHA